MTDEIDIETQAARWLARRDAREGSADEEAEFKAWLVDDPRRRASYLRLAAAWQRSANLRRMRPGGSAPVDPDLLAPQGSRWNWGYWGRRLAVAASLAVLGSFSAWWVIDAGGEQNYRTEVGGLSRVVLQDGSTVTLNTDTRLRVRFSASRRQVELLHGEAQFSVAHQVQRPFDVLAGGRIVRAVGTAFDVRLGHGETMEVTVTEGRVAIVEGLDAAAGVSAPTVSAGETAIASAGKVTVKRVDATEAARRLAWQSGELSFKGETLAQAVAEFNRYNRRKLHIADASIESLEVGGNFQALDLDSFVAALNRAFGISARPAASGDIILQRDPGGATPSQP